GGNVAGRDRIHAYTPAAQLLRERLRESDQTRLGGRVVGLTRIAVYADDRRDVDDHTGAALQHRPRQRPAGEEGAAQVGVDHGAPILVGETHDQVVPDDARVVDKDRDRADVALHGAYQLRRALGGGHVALHRVGAAARLAHGVTDRVRGGRIPGVVDGHLRAGGRQLGAD